MGRLKVVFINGNPFWGGAEKWHVGTAGYLKSRGHEVNFFASNVKIARKVMDVHVPVSLMRFSSDIDPATMFRLYRALRRIKPDAVIFNSERDMRLGGSAASLAGVKVRIHRKGISGVKKNARYMWTYRNLRTHTLCVANAVREEIVALDWVEPESLVVIYSGVDVDKFTPGGSKNLRAEIGAADEDVVIGAVARMSSIKGFDYLIEAFKKVTDKHSNTRLLFAGTGRIEDELKQKVNELSLDEIVTFAGFREDAPDATRSMDIIAHPSLHTEGFPNSLIEAMACGKPVVATPVAGIPEAVEDSRTGILVPPGEVEALAEALMDLVSDPQKRESMGQAARERAVNNFKFQDKMGEFEKWLEKII